MTTPDPTPSPAAPPDDLVRRCTAYLSLGGLWNPESMEHDKVRDLVIDCRAAIVALEGRVAERELETKGAHYRADHAYELAERVEQRCYIAESRLDTPDKVIAELVACNEYVPETQPGWDALVLREERAWQAARKWLAGANGWVWKRAPFAEYDRHRKNQPEPTYDIQQGLFV